MARVINDFVVFVHATPPRFVPRYSHCVSRGQCLQKRVKGAKGATNHPNTHRHTQVNVKHEKGYSKSTMPRRRARSRVPIEKELLRCQTLLGFWDVTNKPPTSNNLYTRENLVTA